MLNKKTSRLLLTIAVTACSLHASAQISDQDGPKSTKENSPYSRFGIGNLNNGLNAMALSMGGTATAYTDAFSVNSFNPATYSFIKATSLDFGLQASSNSVFMDNKNYSSGTVTFSYFSLGIPVNKYGGLVFGFKPISTMYFNSNDTSNVDGLGNTVFNNNGSGGTQYAYLGLSGRYKGFSLGFNAGYVFGSFDYAQSFYSLDKNSDSVPSSRGGDFMQQKQVGGLYWKGGLMYQAKLKKDHFLNIGATLNLSQKLTVHEDTWDRAYIRGADGGFVSLDTVNQNTEVKGALQMPAEYALGVSYGKEMNWSIGADFKYADWANFQMMGDRTGISDDAWRMSIGGEFTPNPKATYKKYLSMVTYRLGAYYGKDNISLNGIEVDYVGGTIGASFPLKRQFTQFGRINTTLDMGKRGTTENGLAREFFVKFTFGLSLNDIWFIRPKYN